MKELSEPREQPLVNGDYLLEKFYGKGGWTYASIPEIKPDKTASFGWVKVCGSIDSYELRQYKLMPRGNGEMFLPVKKAIRKKINKEAGSYVRLILYLDRSDYVVPVQILECFQNEPAKLLSTFSSFTDNEKQAYVDWILSAGTVDTKVRRISLMMERLERGLRWHQSDATGS